MHEQERKTVSYGSSKSYRASIGTFFAFSCIDVGCIAIWADCMKKERGIEMDNKKRTALPETGNSPTEAKSSVTNGSITQDASIVKFFEGLQPGGCIGNGVRKCRVVGKKKVPLGYEFTLQCKVSKAISSKKRARL